MGVLTAVVSKLLLIWLIHVRRPNADSWRGADISALTRGDGHVIESGYLECQDCRKLVHDPNLQLGRVDIPCPLCASFGSSRGIWPSLDALKLLDVAFDQDVDSQDGHRVAVLFLASAFEVMLADILSTLVKGHSPSERLADVVLDEWDTLARRKLLFNRLSVRPLGEILSTPAGQQFLQDWDALAKRRNQLAHGHYYYRGSEDAVVLRRLQEKAFQEFASIHNEVEDQLQDDPPTPPNLPDPGR